MAHTQRRIRMSAGDRIFTVINAAILILIFIITLYPLIYVVSASISSPDAVASGKMLLWPVDVTLDGYKYILKYNDIWLGYANTIFYTVVGTIVNLFFTLTCAYATSRRDMVGRNVIMTLFLITMYFSGGTIPTYLNWLEFGLVNTRTIMLLNGAVSAYNLIVARTFFANSIPWDLHEAAFLDGCSDLRIFLKIILPLSSPIVVVMMLYYGIGHWNAYFNAMIYLQDRIMYPLQVFLKEILTQGSFGTNMGDGGAFTPEEMEQMIKQAETANLIKYGIIVVSTAPMLAIYPWLQKFFAKGVMIGSVKG